MHSTLRRAARLALAGTLLSAAAALAAPDMAYYEVHNADGDVPATGKGFRTLQMEQSKDAALLKIKYHGGPVILGTVNVYYIWYGNWAGSQAKTILTDWGNTIGGSPYYNINTTYGSTPPPTRISNSVVLAQQIDDSYSHGTNLSDTAVQQIVTDKLNNGSLPRDPNGVYFVLTSADVSETSGFCSVYCGWHTYTSNGGMAIKYSFVGDPTRCTSACEVQTMGPNGSTGADGMANIMAHELEETHTDPQLNAWFFASGEENADHCVWTFGSTYISGNGATANMKLGARDFLIQQQWNAGPNQHCGLSYP